MFIQQQIVKIPQGKYLPPPQNQVIITPTLGILSRTISDFLPEIAIPTLNFSCFYHTG